MDKHILVVEDDYLISGMLRDLLEGEGYHVVCVPTVALAMHILGSADEHPVDLIVLDLQLPDGYGLDFLKKIQGIREPDPPILIISARVPPRTGPLPAAVKHIFPKPFDVDRLLRAIGRELSF
ncbi:MAG: response regulator [Chloroflexaceae bacterium]|nr:response regulator [Chloroflexaceae bacterium]NJL35085.1 response regulator [Chloroflexaceae bacterium]NJO04819.1 response regulator [Chloroflexaceae bacterium]